MICCYKYIIIVNSEGLIMYWGKYLNVNVKSNEQIRKEQKDLKNDEEKPKNIFKIGLYQNSKNFNFD